MQLLASNVSDEELRNALPRNLRNSVSKEALADINATMGDEVLLETLKDTVLSYTDVLQQGRFKLTSYLSACKYVTLQLLKKGNQVAWSQVFPERHRKLVADGASAKTISAYVSAYNSSKLVVLITKQTLVPLYVVNQPYRQAAVNRLMRVLDESGSDIAVVQACNTLLNELKPPEEAAVELNVTVKDESLTALSGAMAEVAAMQLTKMQDGVDPKSIIEGKFSYDTQSED